MDFAWLPFTQQFKFKTEVTISASLFPSSSFQFSLDITPVFKSPKLEIIKLS